MEPVDVLAISAHPDDAELGCAGALLLAADAGMRVAVADLTAGERASRGRSERRAVERQAAARILGLCDRPQLGLPDTALGTDPGHRLVVAELLRRLRPRVVLAPYPEDRHPDHAAAGRLAREAVFLAGVADLGDGDAFRPEYLYHYQIHQPFPPTFVLDVSAVWDRKVAAVTAYGSQFGDGVGDGPPTALSGPRFLDVLAARATFHGAMVGVLRGEPYWASGPIGLPFLPGLEHASSPSVGYRMFL